ncbi:MAG: TatD family hydrolase [Treponema sp.]|jgi:TatD DNase family protein|nr:TatD family hydrolase [Treponema sp.]
MLCDAHCHPYDLLSHLSKNELEAGMSEIAFAASSWNLEQFEYHESLARKAASQDIEGQSRAPVVLCFAVHPQFPASSLLPGVSQGRNDGHYIDNVLLPLLENLAAEKRLHAIGEAGFDLFNAEFRNTEKTQDKIFCHHLEVALKYELPMVLHVRKAMHKIFPHAKKLKKLPSVIFHNWSGTVGEGESLLRQGVNAFFSFGAAIVNNHKQAQRCCAALPLDRILVETDAPYLPPWGKPFSSWADLPLIYKVASDLRDGAELEAVVEGNFFRAFGMGRI